MLHQMWKHNRVAQVSLQETLTKVTLYAYLKHLRKSNLVPGTWPTAQCCYLPGKNELTICHIVHSLIYGSLIRGTAPLTNLVSVYALFSKITKILVTSKMFLKGNIPRTLITALEFH